jgi:hypothetical protein
VVDWDGLENRCAGNRTVGSNPTLSASLRAFRQFAFATIVRRSRRAILMEPNFVSAVRRKLRADKGRSRAMLESQFLAWLAMAISLGFILIAPLLSESIPDYEPRDRR